MNKFNNIKRYTIVAAIAVILSACGGTGSCPPSENVNGNLSLKIEAPSQYPAGVAVTAYLTMTNTSKVDGRNLVYTVPDLSNYTGVSISIDPNGAGQSCQNIASGGSCTFTASIPAGSHPGSFTVVATPNGNSGQSTKVTQSGASLQAGGSIAVTANLGLVDIPNTGTPFYVLPEEQTVIGSSIESTIAYVSVMVRAGAGNFNELKLVDESGNLLSYKLLNSTTMTGTNNVNSYAVTIPAGRTIQHIQAFSYLNSAPVCITPNTCSNDADVNLGTSGIGILSIQPNNFVMSPSYESQVVTISNIGTGKITQLSFPTISQPFNISGNTCNTSLEVGGSCQLVINYTPGVNSSNASYVVSYNNSKQDTNTTVTIPYIGNTPVQVGLLTASPNSISLNGGNLQQTITLENTGEATLTNLSLPNLQSPLQLITTTCTNSQSLAVHQTCNYTLGYSSAASSGNVAVSFGYNNGQTNSNTSVAVDWTELVSTAAALSLNSGSVVTFESVNSGQQFFAVFTQNPISTTKHTYTATFESQVSSCDIDVGQTSCSVPLVSGTGGLKPVQFGYTLGNVSLSPESEIAPINGIWAYVSGTTGGNDGAVKIYSLNVFNGELSFVKESSTDGGPWGTILFAPNGTTMYVGLAYNGGDSTRVFNINPLTGDFTQIQSLVSMTSATTKSLAFAGESTLIYYGLGALFSYAINPDGTLTEASNINLGGPSYCGTSGSIRYSTPTVSPSNNYLFIGCSVVNYPIFNNNYIMPFSINPDHSISLISRYNVTGGTTSAQSPSGLYMSGESLIMTANTGQIYTFGFDGTDIIDQVSKNSIGGAAGFANAGLLIPDPFGAPYLYTVKNVAAGSYANSLFGIDISNQSASSFPLTTSVGVNASNAAIFDPSGKYFYTTSFTGGLNNSQIFQFSYESNAHTFTPLTADPITSQFGSFIRTIAISGTGNY